MPHRPRCSERDLMVTVKISLRRRVSSRPVHNTRTGFEVFPKK